MKLIPKRDTIQTILGVVVSIVAGNLLLKWDFLLAWLTAHISYKLLLMVAMTELFILLLVVTYIIRHSKNNIQLKSIAKENADTFHNILSLIAMYHSQDISATTNRIAKDLDLDPKITLAHMDKMHNNQFITFRNDGKPPDLGTAFFLSPKAWECIAVVKRESKL